eukprot:SAG11_NODE_322_length_10757_cov_2.841809_7_plen_407_part_00
MGIRGVLPASRAIQDRVGRPYRKGLYTEEFRGSLVGVDGHGLLHRAASGLGIAEGLVLCSDPSSFIRKVLSMHRQMKRGVQQADAANPDLGIRTVTVFDGAPAQGKKVEKMQRREKADAALRRVRQMQASGREPDGQDIIVAAASFLTVELVAQVVDALNAAGFSTVVALREADSQLAYMARSGQIDHVLTVDSDLIAHGCPSVLLIPAPSRRARDMAQPAADRFDFTTGTVVHHFVLDALCSLASAHTELAAAQPQPKPTDPACLALWLGAILAKHGASSLQLYGAIVTCDYGSVTGAGPTAAAKALLDIPSIDDDSIMPLSATLSAAVGVEYRRTILHTRKKELLGEDTARPTKVAARAPGAAAAVIAMLIRRTLVCFRDALAFDREKKQVVTLREVRLLFLSS